MQFNLKCLLVSGAALSLLACSSVPSGPSTLVLPGDNIDEKQFRRDDTNCRSLAKSQLLALSQKPQSLEEGQLHYDITYLQCMYSKGNLIPVPGDVVTEKPTNGSSAGVDANSAPETSAPSGNKLR